MALRSSSSSSIWNSSSRGYVSRMLSSALPAWLPGATPERATTFATLLRSSGIDAGGELYAVDVYRPTKRCSPMTLPSGSKRFTPT